VQEFICSKKTISAPSYLTIPVELKCLTPNLRYFL